MADAKISALSAASALAGTEAFPGVQSSSTVKVTAAQIATYVAANLGAAAGNSVTLTGTSVNSVTVISATNASATLLDGASTQAVLVNAGGTAFGIAGWANATVIEASGAGGLVLGTYGSSTPGVTLQANRISVAVFGPNAANLVKNTAIPAGGTAGVGVTVSTTSNFGVFFGSGVPALAAAKGSLYLRSDGSSTSTRLYVNTDGSTTWTNVVTAA